jgi:hypothetical protein
MVISGLDAIAHKNWEIAVSWFRRAAAIEEKCVSAQHGLVQACHRSLISEYI